MRQTVQDRLGFYPAPPWSAARHHQGRRCRSRAMVAVPQPGTTCGRAARDGARLACLEVSGLVLIRVAPPVGAGRLPTGTCSLHMPSAPRQRLPDAPHAAGLANAAVWVRAGGRGQLPWLPGCPGRRDQPGRHAHPRGPRDGGGKAMTTWWFTRLVLGDLATGTLASTY